MGSDTDGRSKHSPSPNFPWSVKKLAAASYMVYVGVYNFAKSCTLEFVKVPIMGTLNIGTLKAHKTGHYGRTISP